jgi:hypothetical protein
MDLLNVPNKYTTAHLIGDAARIWFVCGHWTRGEAKKFETQSNRLRIGIRTLSVIRGKSNIRAA